MLGDALASRFEFGTQAAEDKLGRHVAGRRLADGAPVVLTVLDPQLKVGAAEAHAVAQGAIALAGLKSSAILYCLETGRTEGGNLYVLCEGTEAPTLKTLLRSSGGLSPEQALAAAYQVASVLHDAAGAGVTHLDLSNTAIHLAFDDGLRVQVAKFGHARLLPSYNPSRKNEPYHGTAEYMAPEVCAGRPGDASADLYALGILMYEMVAGKPPFLSSSPSTTIKRQVYEKPLPLHLVKPGMAKMEAYEALVNRLLAKDPKARPASAEEVAKQIVAIRDEAFPGVALSAPAARDVAVEPVSLLATEIAAAQAAPVEAAPSGGTQIFTGLSEAVAEAQAARDASGGAAAPRPAAGESRPTEAFDASFVAAALDAAKAKADAAAAAPAAEVVAAQPAEAPVPEAAEAPAGETWQGTDAVTGPVPVTAFAPRDQEERKESRMFWFVAAAVAVLVAIAIGVYLKGRSADLDADAEPAVAEEAAAPAPAPAPAPKPAPRPMTPIVPTPAPAQPQDRVAPAPAPAATDSPVIVRQAGPTPQEKAADLVERARGELAGGRLQGARDSLQTALEMDPGNADAKRLLETVEARIRAASRATAPAPATAPRPKRVSTAPTTAPAPAPKPAGPQMSDAERKAKVGDLIKSGRAAYNDGDYKTAIARYNQALSLEPGNALVGKLLDQAKAKAAE